MRCKPLKYTTMSELCLDINHCHNLIAIIYLKLLVKKLEIIYLYITDTLCYKYNINAY